LEKLNIRGKIAIIGIAKRLEEIYFPEDPIPLYIDKNSESLKIIQNIRNEAHRFGINFHRLKRSGSLIKSELNSIPGLGEKTIRKIWDKYNSIQEIKNAPINEIEKNLGKSIAKILYSYFNAEKSL
jgi:excinuclease ABC subunit C